MPPLFWVDIIGLSISILVTFSLTLSVIGVDPKNPINLSFGLFTGTVAFWTTSALLLRLSLWLEPILSTPLFLLNPNLWRILAAIFIVLTCIFSLLFTVTFLSRRTHWTDMALVFASLLFFIFLVFGLSNKGAFIKSVQFDEYGLIQHEKSKLAWLMLGVWGSYIVWSIILFWQERHRNGAVYLAFGMLILLLGLIIRIVIFAPFPFISFSNTTCAFILAYGVISKQLFNPLRVRTFELKKEIVERKQAQEELKESEKKYRRIYDNIIDVYYEANIDGIILEISPSIEKYSQYKRKELIGKSLYDVYTNPEERNKLIETLNNDGSVNEYEINLTDKDGTQHICSINSMLVKDKNGNPIKIVGILRDISDRKKAEKEKMELEEKLVRSQKMKSLGLLAGGVAHDLNNVLSGIVGYPELLLLDLPEGSKLRNPIEIIQESGHRATAIVQDLLTVARGVATTKEVLNLNDLIGDYLDSPEFNKIEQFYSTVTVKANLSTDLFRISGSYVHIRKVVMNLVSNASEAVEGRGNVTISTVNHYVDRPLRGYDDVNIGEYVVLAVSDDGSGISSDDLERIFEPFYTKKIMGRSGTGLGLAVVWNVVQDHKGYIDVVTGENGTTFELYFPITRDEISDKDLSIPIKDYKGKGETVLVVDDMESQREISCKMLDRLGYKTKAVSSGEEAVEYLKENTVDLILLDMIMDPGINGRETYERIIKIHPKQKAIIASGFAETDEVKEAQKLGAGQYIKKPVTIEKIGLAVKGELEK